jgi:hypothetical protein
MLTLYNRKLPRIQFFLPLLKLVSKMLCHMLIVMLQLHVCIPRSFPVINVSNQGKTLCSPCTITVSCLCLFEQEYLLF